MQTRPAHETQNQTSLTELCRRLLSTIEARTTAHDNAPTTWVLPLQHLSFKQLRATLEALKGEHIRINGTHHTLILAGPSARVHALGEMILLLDAGSSRG